MARRVYLHIGTMKSATSHIQALFDLNVETLDNAGIRWLPEGLRYSPISDLFGGSEPDQGVAGAWAALAGEIRRYPGDVVLSNELLAPMNDRRIRRLLNRLPSAERQVIITARDLARVIPSHWQTTLKNGRTLGWSDFSSAVCTEDPAEGSSFAARTHDWFWLRHDVAGVIARWQQFVPVEQITLVTVPPAGSDPRLVGDRFGSVVGVQSGALQQPESSSNPSLGAHTAELMRRLNEAMTDAEKVERSYGFRLAFVGAVMDTRAHPEPNFALSQAQHDWVRGRADRMIAEIQRSGVTVVGDLADLLPAAHPVAGAVDPADTSETDLLRAASQTLLGLAKVAAELSLESQRLARHTTAPAKRQVEPQRPVAQPGDGTGGSPMRRLLQALRRRRR